MSLLSSHRLVSLYSVVACAGMACGSLVYAADVEIDDDRTSNLDTTSLLGDSGTLTLTENGSVTVGSGTALTLNGNHNLLLQGTLTSDAATNGRALGVFTSDLRLTSDLEIEGALEVANLDDESVTSNHIGLGIFGDGVFDGDLNLRNSSSITVEGGGAKGIYIEGAFEGDIYMNGGISVVGPDGIGVDLAGPITGDVTIDGSIASSNENGIGIRQQGPIEGGFIHEGTISVGAGATTDSDGNTVDAKAGVAGIYLTEDIRDGVLLDGAGYDYNADVDPYDPDGDGNEDAIPTSVIGSTGGAPGLLIENLKDDGDALVIGTVEGGDYALVHRGSITVAGQSSGLSATGIRIAGGETGASTMITGGIHIDGGRVNVSALDAEAVGVEIDDGAAVPKIYNRGTVQASTAVTFNNDGNDEYSAGGSAAAIKIKEGATVQQLENVGTLAVSVAGADNVGYAILDQSGTLTSIINSGSLITSRGTNNSGEAFAIDVRSNTSGVDFTNSGTVIGDIALGAGGDTVTLTDGEVTGDIDFGAGTNQFRMTGDAVFTGGVSHSGALDFYVQGADLALGANDTFNVTNAFFTDEAGLNISINASQQAAGKLVVQDTLTISADTTITARYDTLVLEEQTYQIAEAGTLVLDGPLTVTDEAFLMRSFLEPIQDGGGLSLRVRPKTSQELGFDGNRAILYDNIFGAVEETTAGLGGALASLENAEAVEDAMQTLMPDTTNASFQMIYSGVRQLEASLNDRLIEVSAKPRLQGGLWGREVVAYGNMTGKTSEQKVDYLGAGIMLGYDFALSDSFLWGIGAGFLLQGADRETAIGDDVSLFSPYLSTYLIAKSGSAFVSTSASIWYNDINRDRELGFGGLDSAISSSASGYTGTLDAHAGYDLKIGGLHLRPKIGASYIHVHEGKYTEEGGGEANLAVASRTFSRLDGTGRLDIGHDFKWGRSGTIIRPEIFGIYRKRLGGDDVDMLEASFVSGDEVFTLAADEIAETSYEFGGALNVFGGFGTASLRYSYEKRDEWKVHYAGFNFQMPF